MIYAVYTGSKPPPKWIGYPLLWLVCLLLLVIVPPMTAVMRIRAIF